MIESDDGIHDNEIISSNNVMEDLIIPEVPNFDQNPNSQSLFPPNQGSSSVPSSQSKTKSRLQQLMEAEDAEFLSESVKDMSFDLIESDSESNDDSGSFSQRSNASSAISLIEDSENESCQENNEDLNDLEEVNIIQIVSIQSLFLIQSIYAEPYEVLSQGSMSQMKETKFEHRSQLPVAKKSARKYHDSSSESELDLLDSEDDTPRRIDGSIR